ncbi:MAG: SDR family oxidoreductase [Gammaproteobacteria bacterium]|nr:SDR family oxidoreductase [Gammaproteobacteria bacterium]
MQTKPLVVITGASQGIGKSLAIAFAKQGNPLLLISRHIKPMIELQGHNALYEQVDVTDFDSLQKAIRKAEDQYGKTDCLINNAGFIEIGKFTEMPIETCNYEFDVIVKGVMNGIKCVLLDMSTRKAGTIINISSIDDRRANEMAVIYDAGKHAVRAMSEALQKAEGQNLVRIMNIAPGLIKTNIHEKMGITFEEYCQQMGNPDFIAPEELAEIILFCYQLPQRICIRDIVIMPTSSNY